MAGFQRSNEFRFLCIFPPKEVTAEEEGRGNGRKQVTQNEQKTKIRFRYDEHKHERERERDGRKGTNKTCEL